MMYLVSYGCILEKQHLMYFGAQLWYFGETLMFYFGETYCGWYKYISQVSLFNSNLFLCDSFALCNSQQKHINEHVYI